jgi:hypothetical protein
MMKQCFFALKPQSPNILGYPQKIEEKKIWLPASGIENGSPMP